jgi:predicted NAD-dependent protein-ADP-ribosyltransferase YbiA (DUF1768 family)
MALFASRKEKPMLNIPKRWDLLAEDERFLFYSGRGWRLSNFAAVSFLFRGNYCPTAEHPYQAWKFANHKPIFRSIIEARDPGIAKEIAHAPHNKNLWLPEWNDNPLYKLQLMLEIKRDQVEQNPKLLQNLLELSDNGKVWLIENSHQDAVYGRGPNWDGDNWLGVIYMIIVQEQLGNGRSQLREETGLK